jgi:serine/threonine-protein kinase
MRRGDRELGLGERIAGTNYVVIHRETHGGQATLYRVHHHALDSLVFALKILHADLRAFPGVAARMQLEALIVGAMSHPNIVRVFDAGTTAEVDPDTGQLAPRPFLAMEWLRGRTLAYVLGARADAGIGVEAALEVAAQVADALDYAYAQHRVVHRDVKPQNIYLQMPAAPGGRTLAKLLDFGVARVLGTARVTQRGIVMGTPGYLAPELLRGAEATPQSDLYALGLVLYEMLAGAPPFREAKSVDDLIDAHLMRAPRPIARADVPPAVEELAMQCLHKRPDKRPESATALANRLRELQRPDQKKSAAQGAGPANALDAVASAMASPAHSPEEPSSSADRNPE